YHEWLIAFENMPYDLKSFERTIDEKMQELNIYYKDLLKGKILRTLKITPLQKDAFQLYMKSLGKLGGQNKVPRLSNDRKLADVVLNWKLLR
ncbi:MAG: GH3 auxin-responsive promoter family protein, partial [Flammeovirgaceae bacterium]|nr:GH3 auxin-responsive promoter family protein [Flammeovirgaceae bacterium]MDW8287566.1 GH3 auxin-responsive promoter family protein [Flammeovirgaceae bacterium]